MKLADTLDHVLRLLFVPDRTQEPVLPAARETPAPQPGDAVATMTPAAAAVAVPDLEGLESAAQLAEKLGLGFHLGSAIERIALAAREGNSEARLREARWLIERHLHQLEAAVDVIERDPMRDERVGVDVAVQVTLDEQRHLIASLDTAERRAGNPPARDQEAGDNLEHLAPPGDARDGAETPAHPCRL